MPARFIFDQQLEESNENDDVIGCVSQDERRCICVVCGKDCMYRGSMRCEVI